MTRACQRCQLWCGRWFIITAMVVVAAGGGCDKGSCRSSSANRAASEPATPQNWAARSVLLDALPATARTVVVARDVATMAEMLRFSAARLQLAGADDFRDAWRKSSAVDPADAQSLGQLGIAADAPVVLFYDRGLWSLALGLAEPDRLSGWLEAHRGGDDGADDATVGDMTVIDMTAADAATAPVYLAHGGDSLFLSVRVEPSNLAGEVDGFSAAWLADSSKSRFFDRSAHRKLLDRLSPTAECVGIIRPAAWLAGRPTPDGQRGILWQRLVGQIGPVGLAVNAASMDQAVDIHVLTPGDRRAPAIVTALGNADGALPALGGLIEPGVLGVMRLSVAPRQLYRLLVSALPADQRRELERFWQQLDRDLRVNARRDVLQNLRGHAVMVAYGLDRDTLEGPAPADLWGLVTLEATHEAVLLPIKEREPLVNVLDALTTVTKNKLSRQAVGPNLQYAWLEDGELQWAIIVADDHVIYVDSAVAFGHANTYRRQAHRLADVADTMGLAPVVAADKSAGLYVQAADISRMLTDAGHPDIARWLAPFDTIVATTAMDQTTGVTDIHLTMAPPAQATGQASDGSESSE